MRVKLYSHDKVHDVELPAPFTDVPIQARGQHLLPAPSSAELDPRHLRDEPNHGHLAPLLRPGRLYDAGRPRGLPTL